MASLAQRLREEGKMEMEREWRIEGMRLEKVDAAKRMIKLGSDIDYIAEITDLPNEEIEKYIPKSH